MYSHDGRTPEQVKFDLEEAHIKERQVVHELMLCGDVEYANDYEDIGLPYDCSIILWDGSMRHIEIKTPKKLYPDEQVKVYARKNQHDSAIKIGVWILYVNDKRFCMIPPDRNPDITEIVTNVPAYVFKNNRMYPREKLYLIYEQ